MKINPLKLIPWYSALDAGLKVAVAAGAGLLILAGAWLTWSVVNAPQRAASAKIAAHAATVETQVQGAVTQKALGVVQAGAARDAKTQQQHEENSRAFHQLPSASLPLPDADADAFARRECMYQSQRGSGSCAGLPQAGS